MDVQNIVVAIIVIAALAYVGQIVWRKTKSFSSKSDCGADCGCSSDAEQKLRQLK